MKLRRLTWYVMLAFLGPSWVWTPASASTALDNAQACRKALTTKGRTYADKRGRLLLGCLSRLVKCELKLESDGENPNACRGRAEDSCKRTLDTTKPDKALSRAITSFQDKVAAACSPLGIAPMLSNTGGGLWFANDAVCGTSIDVPALLSCIRGELEIEVDGIVGRTIPRGGLLLDNVRLSASASLGDLFPSLPRPPSVSVLLSAVAIDTGDLVNPGTVVVPAGNGVKFTGDAATLPCGGGQNGKVTIFVSTAANPCNDPFAQQQQLKEPYGPTQSVTLGPYTADQNYCITLMDTGMCSDTESGSIDVQ